MTSREEPHRKARSRTGERSAPAQRRTSTAATPRKSRPREQQRTPERPRTPRAVKPRVDTAESDEQGSVFERAIEWVKAQVRRLLDAVRERSHALTKQLQEWMDSLFDAIENSSPRLKAVVEALRAVMSGKNPVWAAIKGLWTGLSAGAKALLILAVIVAILLLPVLVVVLLLALLVVAVIVAIRAGSD
ncbi:hypothetical protein [Mycolicibacterium smegmatis]|uniref:hypothetical protein n=1 Tax=Mycolicibacterium smegmatis TaxID=1772 RepID=UPI001E506931|nr:hypothetical protein [Mycolicibacterium smegmatis]